MPGLFYTHLDRCGRRTVVSTTRDRQIMASKEVVDALPEEFDDKVVEISRASFRGKQDTLAIYQLLWEPEDSAMRRIGDETLRKMKAIAGESTDPQLAKQLAVAVN